MTLLANFATINVQTLNRRAWWWAIGLFLLQFLPYLLLGEQSYVRIHDTLEGEWYWYQLLVDSGLAFDYSSDAAVEQLMNGLPRRVLPGALSFIYFLIAQFGLFWGYLCNAFLMDLAGFVGMILLLKRYFLTEEEQLPVVLGVALIFSWIPYFNTFGISVSGFPLLIWSLLNLAKSRAKWLDYLIIGLFPFYSSMVWMGIPVLFLTGVFFLRYSFLQKRFHLPLFIAGFLLLAGYVAGNYQLFEVLLMPGDFVSHRKDYSYLYNKNLKLGFSLQHTLMLLLIGHYHVGTMVSLPILATLLFVWKRQGSIGLEKRLLWGIVALCLFYGFYNWVVQLLGSAFPLVETFKFERFRIVLPFLWYFLFAILLGRLWKKPAYQKLVIFLIASQLLITIFTNDEFQHNTRQLIGLQKKPNFQEFFAAEMWTEIADFIGKPKSSYRVAHLGIHPTVSLFNGFYTLDGHQAIYEYSYKKQFGKMMKNELPKNEIIENEFNRWGNRCYLYSARLGKEGTAFMIGKNQSVRLDDWQFEIEPFQALGGEYLLSAVELSNAPALGLQLARTFEHPDSYWRIHLYQPIMPENQNFNK